MHVCAGIQRRSSSLTGQGIPVVFHTDYSPAGLLRRVQRILSTRDVIELALGVVVQHSVAANDEGSVSRLVESTRRGRDGPEEPGGVARAPHKKDTRLRRTAMDIN
jgi:hypothetical protein